ncbi:hypothetical protein [Brumimicrobium oceani]|uniref:DUF4412 domain-containing protein n=1 Tax=Brumimicrobium oceani TaxID=2100725 RepID=A0A2U2XBX3_9FLAO|nr:hypothetical protein [Brumimicrobium oceani]PWH85295.1 hypothetical protein DIT68_10175 [Brumimicrobium oceani]
MKIKAILSIAVFMFSMTAISQVNKGKISYDVYLSSDDPAVAAYADQMEGSMLELTFMDGKIRSDMFIGQMMTTTSISHKGQDTTLVLLDGMMGKIAMKVTENDMDEEQRLAYEDREIELIDETKEIMGYTCKKAILTAGDANESVIWYTDEIMPSYREGQYLYEEIPGTPLEMYSKWGKMDMKIVAYEFKEKLKKTEEIFNKNVPDGFTVKTSEEMRKFGR